MLEARLKVTFYIIPRFLSELNSMAEHNPGQKRAAKFKELRLRVKKANEKTIFSEGKRTMHLQSESKVVNTIE